MVRFTVLASGSKGNSTVVSGGRTRTQIERLAKDARVEEIARMLGGRDLTSVTLKHTREMLQQA